MSVARDAGIRQGRRRRPPENPSFSDSPAYDDGRTRLAVQRKLAGNRGLPGSACLKNNRWSSESVIAREIRREGLACEGGNGGVKFRVGKKGLDARPGEKHLAPFIDKLLKSLSLFPGRCFQRVREDQDNVFRIAGKLGRGALPPRNVVVKFLKKQIGGARTAGTGGVRRGNRTSLL